MTPPQESKPGKNPDFIMSAYFGALTIITLLTKSSFKKSDIDDVARRLGLDPVDLHPNVRWKCLRTLVDAGLLSKKTKTGNTYKKGAPFRKLTLDGTFVLPDED